MENKKPELSAALRGRLNELYRLLKTRRMSKAELMVHFNTGERQIRDMVALLAKKIAEQVVESLGNKVAPKKKFEIGDIVRVNGEGNEKYAYTTIRNYWIGRVVYYGDEFFSAVTLYSEKSRTLGVVYNGLDPRCFEIVYRASEKDRR